jgi:hypothetical protein
MEVASAASLNAYGNHPQMAAREMARTIVNERLKREQRDGVVSSALSDYFTLSALDSSDGKLFLGGLYKDQPLREASQRDEPAENYPSHLNFNSVAQLTSDANQSSQVLLRVLWSLRNELGRESVDKLLAGTLKQLDVPKTEGGVVASIAPLLGGLPPAYVKRNHEFEIYAFLSSLRREGALSGNEILADAIARRAKEIGIVLQ